MLDFWDLDFILTVWGHTRRDGISVLCSRFAVLRSEADPLCRVTGPRMNPSVDVGARRDPLGICAWRSVAHRILVRVELPFIQHWFKNRLPAITNLAGRLSSWMLRRDHAIGKRGNAKRWQIACN